MPIYLFWGDDDAAREHAIEQLIEEIIDPAWLSINLSRLDGSDLAQAWQALEELRSPPFGNGGRVILLQRSPFCNRCSTEMSACFESSVELIPHNSHLLLSSINKPDGRLRTTKLIQKLIKENLAFEKSFVLPQVWDNSGQKELVLRTAKQLGLQLEPEAQSMLVEAIGNDSSRIFAELKKLAIHAEIQGTNDSLNSSILITTNSVRELINGISTNALQIGDLLLHAQIGDALKNLDLLLDSGEPPLRILASLTGQVRGCLWIRLMDQAGEKDVSAIARAAGISNPKRIYVMRKQIQEQKTEFFLRMLFGLLEIEASVKRGMSPFEAFRDGLLGVVA